MTAKQTAAPSVLYVEDEYLYRTCMPRMLSSFVVTAAATGAEALRAAQTCHFDAAVLDIEIPAQSSHLRQIHTRRWLGFQVARKLVQRHPQMAIVFFSGYNDCRRQVELLIAERGGKGATGYVLKGTTTSAESMLNAALTITLNGRDHFSHDIPPAPDFSPAGRALLATLEEKERRLIIQGYERIDTLTPMQYATWKACAISSGRNEAAQKRGVSVNTIETEIKQVYINFFSGSELKDNIRKQKYAHLIWRLHRIESEQGNAAFAHLE